MSAPDLPAGTVIESGAPSPEASDRFAVVRSAVALAILFAVFMTLNPFADLADPQASDLSGGKEAASYLTLLALLGVSAVLLYPRLSLIAGSLVTRANVLLAVWLAISVVLSSDPETSARRLVITAATFALAAVLPWLTIGLRNLTNLMLITAITILLLSYVGLVLVPELTIHQVTDLAEPDIAGDWRGIYSHKNLAASMMVVFAYVGWFTARTGRPGLGFSVAVGAITFLVGTGGKNSLGMLFVAGSIAVLVVQARSLRARVLIALGPLALISFLTVGSVMSETARSLLALMPGDVTFTGRTEIWSFALDAIREHPWKGRGFEAFWYSDAVRFGAEDSTRWMVDVATSHNSYVDLVLTIGLPGLVLVILAFVIMPLRDFHRARAEPENQELARLFLALWLFSLYFGVFEAFFISRANPMWFVLALAVCGLRFTALYPVTPERA